MTIRGIDRILSLRRSFSPGHQDERALRESLCERNTEELWLYSRKDEGATVNRTSLLSAPEQLAP